MTVIETGLKDNRLTKYNSKTDLKRRSPLIRKKDSPLKHANIVSGMPKPYQQVKNLYNNKNNSPGKNNLDTKSNFNKRQEISPKKLGLNTNFTKNMDIREQSLTNLSIKNTGRNVVSSKNITGTTHNISNLGRHSNNQSTLSLKDKIEMKLNKKSSTKLR